MATYQKITSLLFKPQGVHNAAVDYSVMDVVTSPDKSRVYFAVQNVPAGIALTNTEYWQLQIDLSSSKSAMDEALASFGSYAKEIGTRVKGETAKASGNPVTCLADAGSLLQPVTVLEPQQAGSGDPYPAGGGKNLLPITAKTQTINGVTFTVDNGVITANGTATANAYLWLCDEFTLQPGTYVMSGIPENFDYNTQGGFTDDNWSINRYGVTTLTEAKKVKPYVVIRNGVTASNVVFKLQLEAGSTATAFMPYSNIRPFIGYDVLWLNHAGKNLYDKNNPNIIKGWFNAEGGAIGSSSTQNTIYIPCSPNTTYTVSKILGGNRFRVAYAKEKPNLGTTVYGYVGGSDNSTALKITTGRDAKYLLVWAWTSDGSTVTWEELNASIQIEIGSTASTFEPYKGNTHAVQIGQTVYGGKFDWLTGKFMSGFSLLDMATLSWNYDSANGYWIAVFQKDAAQVKDNSQAAEWLCDRYKVVARNNLKNYTVALNVLGNVMCMNGSSTVKPEGVIAYKLATPIEIQLTPHIISAAEPEQTNTLYGDGRIDVEYVKPLHVSIEERVAAAVAAAMNTEGE